MRYKNSDDNRYRVKFMRSTEALMDSLPVTGCMFCGFGCHFGEDQRFVRLKETHPKVYEYIMKPVEDGGLGYKEMLEWINENGNMDIEF